jgi:hypothetical protein
MSSVNALRRAIWGVSKLFTETHTSSARSHIFLISVDGCDGILLPKIDRGIGLSTITLDHEFDLRGSAVPNGWHLYPDMISTVPENADAVLLNKIFRTITHLRTGLASGQVTELELELIPGRGCAIETIVGQTSRSRLRLGEKWSILVLMRVSKRPNEDDSDDTESKISKILKELHVMLKSEHTNEQTILTATLGFEHSLMSSTFLALHEVCTVLRVPDAEVDSHDVEKVGHLS